MIESSSLVGGWRLVEWSASVDDVDAGHPMGPDVGGQLTYTTDGRSFENRLVWERFDRTTSDAGVAS